MQSNTDNINTINRELIPVATINGNYEVDFDVQNGSCYLCCCWGLVSYGLGFFCCCVAHKFMTSQEVHFEDKSLNYKSDCYFIRVDKKVPYDRIQDVNITENCIQRCFGVHDVSIQTAGGGEKPEVVITAARNPHQLRDVIMSHRDHSVSNQPSGHRDDGTGVSSMSPLLGDGKDSAGKQQELVGIHQSLLRIEKLMSDGLNKM